MAATIEDHGGAERIPIIDTDVHSAVVLTANDLQRHLPKEVAEYIRFRGLPTGLTGERPRQRPFAARTDSFTPSGGQPGSDPQFARRQLLDEHDFCGAVINDLPGRTCGGKKWPDRYVSELARAYNDMRAEKWLASDDRWYGSITLDYEIEGAEREIQRCREMPEYGDRWVQVMLGPDNEKPVGHQKYWPIFEACEHYDMPVAFHVLNSRHITGTGIPNYYFEEHTDFALYNFPLVSSLVFEGVFERFPKLKIAMIELAWSWAVPFAWRMDHAYEMLRGEVPHLTKKPSEYMAEHFWYSTQPMEEPEELRWFDGVYQLFVDTMGDRLMYSSDYPHWDFDKPEILAAAVPPSDWKKVLGENASQAYGIPLREGTGMAVDLVAA